MFIGAPADGGTPAAVGCGETHDLVGDELDGRVLLQLAPRPRERNGRRPTYWTTCRVTRCELESAFAFAVIVRRKVVNTWAYELRPNGGGTDVTESFELTNTVPVRAYWALAGRSRRKTNQDGMRTTLERIKAVVESEVVPTS